VRRLLFYTILVLVVCALVGLYVQLKNSGELGSKPEASFLQSLQVEYHNASLDEKIIIRRRRGHCAVGIAARNGKERVWILLNPRFEPLSKITSNAGYELTRNELEWLKKQCNINRAVLEAIEEHVK
jgi:hypothetical protein